MESTMSIALAPFEPRQHLITVKEYHRMAKVGLLAPDARVELIEGVIIDMPPIGSRHSSMVGQLTHSLARAAGNQAFVQPQGSVRLGHQSEPQPDIIVLKPRADCYVSAGPKPTDVLLMIEVSMTTLQYDRKVKIPLYARYGITEYWIVNLLAKQVEIHHQPIQDRYQQKTTVNCADQIGIAQIPGAMLDLSRLVWS